MIDFDIYNPVHIHFGKDVLKKLPETILEHTKKVMLIYGKGSVVKNGYYQIVIDILSQAGIEVVEYSGIRPNPVVSDVEAAIEKGIKEDVGLVLALGGGSVIDSAKIIALCIPDNLDPWSVVKGKVPATNTLPIITVLTLAATGTEMNHFAVVQNEKTQEKLGFRNANMFPAHSFINPEFSYSVPLNYTAYGVVDLIAHSFENYFGVGESPLSERFVAAVVKESMEFGPRVLKEPKNYFYRANIQLQSTFALNGTTMVGKSGGDWGVHAVGHTLSILFDTPHGASLSIAYPAWLKIMKEKIPEKISKLGKLIFDTEDIDEFIEKLESFFNSLGAPVTLQEAGVQIESREHIIALMKKNKITGYKYHIEDYELITDYMYGKQNQF
jgi:alcohol dehydrogenase YqhD (iron-dependent ADH family)